MKTLTLTPPTKNATETTVVIGQDILSTATNILDAKHFDGIVILYDRSLEGIARRTAKSLSVREMIAVDSGDASKSLSQVERIIEKMLAAGCTRETLCICIGGGMMTDLGGFVASIFMRGMPCAYVPTSLLAIVDAAIGGKTALNLGHRKNMIGTLTHPAKVIIDLEVLTKLPDSQLSEGLVEVIKIAAMTDRVYFEWLEKHIPHILARDPALLEECVVRAVEAKIRVVESDQDDQKERLFLNFGHTIGHAIEAASLYLLSHGKAVSIGMALEMRLSGFADQQRVLSLLRIADMPVVLPTGSDKDILWGIMKSDKKNTRGEVRIAVPKVLGSGEVLSISSEQFYSLFA